LVKKRTSKKYEEESQLRELSFFLLLLRKMLFPTWILPLLFTTP
jgi:hypothetical protein